MTQWTGATLLHPEDVVFNVSKSGANGSFATRHTFWIDKIGQINRLNVQTPGFYQFVKGPQTRPCRTPGWPIRP